MCRRLSSKPGVEAHPRAAIERRDPIEALHDRIEVEQFADGTDSLSDQPVSFGDGTSSGPDKRQFAIAPHRRETRHSDIVIADSPSDPPCPSSKNHRWRR